MQMKVLKWKICCFGIELLKKIKRKLILEQPFSGESIGDLLKIQSLIDLPLTLDESIVWLQDLSYFCNQKWFVNSLLSLV